MQTKEIVELAIEALDDLKATDIVTIDVKDITSVTDTLVICSGTSLRHVQSLADNVITKAKEQGFQRIGVEGVKEGEWIVVDLLDVIVHIMQPRAREFYNLEQLWAENSADIHKHEAADKLLPKRTTQPKKPTAKKSVAKKPAVKKTPVKKRISK